MLLSVFPEARRKLREEHDQLFPGDVDETLRLLRDDPGRAKELHYTTAFIQETLRMFPVLLSCREPPPGMQVHTFPNLFTSLGTDMNPRTSFEYKGKTYPIRNHLIAVLSYAVHWDPEVFDEPNEFRPERFLEPDPAFPRSAYRPFERGLRACIGQTLAMDEMRISLLMLARWFDFELRDHNPAARPRARHTNLDTILGDHAFQHSRFSAGPNGDVMMKVRFAAKAE